MVSFMLVSNETCRRDRMSKILLRKWKLAPLFEFMNLELVTNSFDANKTFLAEMNFKDQSKELFEFTD